MTRQDRDARGPTIPVALRQYRRPDRGVRFLLPRVNDRILGRVEIEDVSLGWFSPVEVGGLRVTDPNGREVLRVEGITAGRGLWRALTGARNEGYLPPAPPPARE